MSNKIKILLLFLLSSICVFSQEFRPKGYRCFVDLGGSVEFYWNLQLDKGTCINFSTSHGYLFNPYIFLGGGFGCDYHFGSDDVEVGTCFFPLFVDFRSNFSNKRHTPFLDVKIGYSIQGVSYGKSNGGFYFNPSLGYSFGIKSRSCVNLSVGYTLMRANLNVTEQELVHGSSPYYNFDAYCSYERDTNQNKFLHDVALKVGFEF